jgi:hypothetical protein
MKPSMNHYLTRVKIKSGTGSFHLLVQLGPTTSFAASFSEKSRVTLTARK